MIKKLALVGVGVLVGKYCLKKFKHGKNSSCGCSKNGSKHNNEATKPVLEETEFKS